MQNEKNAFQLNEGVNMLMFEQKVLNTPITQTVTQNVTCIKLQLSLLQYFEIINEKR